MYSIYVISVFMDVVFPFDCVMQLSFVTPDFGTKQIFKKAVCYSLVKNFVITINDLLLYPLLS